MYSNFEKTLQIQADFNVSQNFTLQICDQFGIFENYYNEYNQNNVSVSLKLIEKPIQFVINIPKPLQLGYFTVTYGFKEIFMTTGGGSQAQFWLPAKYLNKVLSITSNINQYE